VDCIEGEGRVDCIEGRLMADHGDNRSLCKIVGNLHGGALTMTGWAMM
jgi:hypothetical protein